jgi:hypothetical protein
VIALMLEALAEVREPEPAVAIEDEVVRAAEPRAFEVVVDALEFAGREVDALDAAGRVVVGRVHGEQHAVRRAPGEAAVVADVHGAVRPDRRAVRSVAELCDHFRPAVPHARQRAASDLDEHDGAVGHGDGAFGELQTFGEYFEVHGCSAGQLAAGLLARGLSSG